MNTAIFVATFIPIIAGGAVQPDQMKYKSEAHPEIVRHVKVIYTEGSRVAFVDRGKQAGKYRPYMFGEVNCGQETYRYIGTGGTYQAALDSYNTGEAYQKIAEGSPEALQYQLICK